MRKVLLPSILVVVATFAAMYLGGFAGNTAARVSREHSVSLPTSVSNIFCLYPISVSALFNSYTISTFTVAPKDAAGLLSQFRQTSKPETLGNSSYYKGESRNGNAVTIQVTQLDPSHTAFYIRTESK